ncbi:uncharacterized protein LOC110026401 [Phalaenopsis equestris]|uniref:uncharacterized protein LOC110026401 n=1 Tax=Phalaenopsis equestris TaxID=78828 RepID=UPI0009E33931|nr:uncharacterized protein LOC110026401 [Phalaenopsis equestris]
MTGRDYDRMKMKNKWDQLKKDWKLWKELKQGSTGMGWDPVKRTIDAPEEWWAEKLQAVPSAKKFKFVGIDPVMEEKLDGMFTGVVATGTHAFTPNDIGLSSSVQEMDTVQIGDSGDRMKWLQWGDKGELEILEYGIQEEERKVVLRGDPSLCRIIILLKTMVITIRGARWGYLVELQSQSQWIFQNMFNSFCISFFTSFCRLADSRYRGNRSMPLR